jgi:hypothetical protein
MAQGSSQREKCNPKFHPIGSQSTIIPMTVGVYECAILALGLGNNTGFVWTLGSPSLRIQISTVTWPATDGDPDTPVVDG